MDLERRIVELECKLQETLDLLKTVIRKDMGLDYEDTIYLINKIDKLQEN